MPREWDWIRGVEFEGPEDAVACEKFLRDVETILANSQPRLRCPPGPWNPKTPPGRTPIFIHIGLSARPCMDFDIYYI